MELLLNFYYFQKNISNIKNWIIMTLQKAVKAIIFKTEKILLLKRRPIYLRDNYNKYLEKYKFLDKEDIWDLPGGRLTEKESEKDALKREVKEELGIDINICKKYSKWSFIGLDNKKVNVINYLCEIKDKSQKIKLSQEHDKYKWVSIEKLKEYKVKDKSFYKSITKKNI